MFFAEYSLLAMFDTYPASKCTTQNMYTCVCAGSVVIDSLRTALGSLKEERKKTNLRGRRFRFTTLETSDSRLLKVSLSSEKSPDHSFLEEALVELKCLRVQENDADSYVTKRGDV